MAGEIVDTSGKTLTSANTEATKLEKTFEKIEKRVKVIQAFDIADKIAAGTIPLKETKELYTKVGDDVDAISKELISITERTEKAKNSTIEWADQVGNVSKNLLGISIPALTINGLLKAAVGTTIDWFNHTFEVNRQMYDIGASLGEIGTRSADFEKTIRDTALAFGAEHEEIRGVANGLADIGFNAEEINNSLEDIYSLTMLWSDITPEKQMQLMSTYIKEFGMNGKEAWATMSGLYATTQGLKEDMPKLDIKSFVDQTQAVATSMRTYGLEAQEAIALTSTLARLGVEQARIPEIAERIGRIGLEDSAETVFMAQQHMLPMLQRQQQAAIIGGDEAGPASPAQMAARERTMQLIKSGPVGAAGAMSMATGEQRTEAQMAALGDRLGDLGVSLESDIEEIVGALTLVDLPMIGKFTIAQAEAFGEAVVGMQGEGMKLQDALKTELRNSTKATEDAKKIAEDQKTDAANAALATIDMATRMKNIEEYVGSIAREIVGGGEGTPGIALPTTGGGGAFGALGEAFQEDEFRPDILSLAKEKGFTGSTDELVRAHKASMRTRLQGGSTGGPLAGPPAERTEAQEFVLRIDQTSQEILIENMKSTSRISNIVTPTGG